MSVGRDTPSSFAAVVVVTSSGTAPDGHRPSTGDDVQDGSDQRRQFATKSDTGPGGLRGNPVLQSER
jgi:hypothetical protein